MRRANVDLLRMADAFVCSITKARSKIKNSSAGLGVFGARKLQKSEVIRSYYDALVHQDLSYREHTRKLYGRRVLKVYLARFAR